MKEYYTLQSVAIEKWLLLWLFDQAKQNERTLAEQINYALDQYCRTKTTIERSDYPPPPPLGSVQDD